MRFALRRARATKGLLLAAAGAALVATVALTGLAAYSRDVVDSGTRNVLSAATAQERSVLVRASAGRTVEALRERDTALREHVEADLDGLPARVSTAGYAAGRQLRGDIGDAVADRTGTTYASVIFLDDLPTHARLVDGAWPQPHAGRVQTALAAAAAATLRVGVGDRIPITDGLTDRVTEVSVVGVFTPLDPDAAYWRLAPETATGSLPQAATYGPMVVAQDDFTAHFLANASAGWLVEPDLSGVGTGAALDRLATAARQITTSTPAAAGLGDSALATSDLGALVQRLQQATLVGRSALVTPMLLVVVLGGYALLLVAVLLTEHRRGETALLRARGAARWQLAGLTAREATLVVLPAAGLAPLLAAELLGFADRLPGLAAISLPADHTPDAVVWLVAGAAALGCALAMIGPSLRRGDSYVADLASRSRPSRRGMVQRAGLDLLLVGLAVLAWYQLSRYSSPLSRSRGGDLGVDPLLAAAPTLGVLAGAVLALRLLPPLIRLAERWLDRRPWTATILGTWQAGRRPHAGPVLLLALAVAVGTLAWSLASTSDRSLRDQAAHRVGADLRLTEVNNTAPDGRAEQVAGLAGTQAVRPVWRDSVRLGPAAEPATMLAVDADAARDVVRVRADLAGGSTGQLFDTLTEGRVQTPATTLPADTRRLTGRLLTRADGYEVSGSVRHQAVLVGPRDAHRRLPLGTSRDRETLRFSVDLPAVGGPWRLAGFTAETVGSPGMTLDWRLSDLRASSDASAGTPIDLTGGKPWRLLGRDGPVATPTVTGGALHARYVRPQSEGWYGRPSLVQLGITRPAEGRVPVVATPQALAALRVDAGAQTRLFLGGADVDVTVVGTVSALPGDAEDAALLVDLPSLSARLFHDSGLLRTPQEWWLSTEPGQAEQVGAAALAFGGLSVLSREDVAAELARDPFGVGARGALFGAALAAVLLAAVGIAVDVSATARRRAAELAVLHTLGAGHRLVARSLLAEQSLLAGMGVLVGLGVGVGVAATMAPLVVLTPSADRPDPPPLLNVDWLPVLATGVGLLALALAFSAAVSVTMRRRLTATHLRTGEDR
ncbi:FtsX-like permease family protein [Micromonospora zingiberis]|uniref:FtsX-like permease family protein n=1 Tax=Micromonospora zingiberis TaxID=2053011 RepID=A0A4V2LXF9_9ACTN|nr:FtsX-like permease family protein [Micromonospora zingiberis]TCC00286.1 FtsX-like permease family protein [Micromonospora zingiberis]